MKPHIMHPIRNRTIPLNEMGVYVLFERKYRKKILQ